MVHHPKEARCVVLRCGSNVCASTILDVLDAYGLLHLDVRVRERKVVESVRPEDHLYSPRLVVGRGV
eukprot:6488135-Amphidinium_carterae.1